MVNKSTMKGYCPTVSETDEKDEVVLQDEEYVCSACGLVLGTQVSEAEKSFRSHALQIES